MNVAARLESLAEPSGICVMVKNLSRPLRSFALRTMSSDPIAYQRVSRSHSREPDAEGGSHRRVPSIAVLPFTNLSKISNLLVVSRNSTFAYKGKAMDVHAVGRELNVRYVLEGSVRKAGDRVRMTAQLVEAVGRQQLWAVRFDREFTDIFALQDEITSNVVAALHVKLIEGEQARRLAWRYEDLRGLGKHDARACSCSGISPRTTTAKHECSGARARPELCYAPRVACVDLLVRCPVPLDRDA